MSHLFIKVNSCQRPAECISFIVLWLENDRLVLGGNLLLVSTLNIKTFLHIKYPPGLNILCAGFSFL